MSALDRDIQALMRSVTEAAILPRYRNLSSNEIVEKAKDELVTVADREADRQRPAAEAARRWLPLASAVVMAQGARPTYASFATVPGSHPFDTDHTLTAATDGAGVTAQHVVGT